VLYFVEKRSPRVRGAWFGEIDRDTNTRQSTVDAIRTGEVDPVKVLEVDEGAGTCRDVTDEIMAQADREAEPVPRTLADRIEWERDHERELRK
jgi:hypothetical protein